MKFLTTNFVQCPDASCAKSSESFPLSFKNVELIQKDEDFDPAFIVNILPRIDWDALVKVAAELGNTSLPAHKPEVEDPLDPEYTQLLSDLHILLIETNLVEGEMQCRNCQVAYHIINSIPNFLFVPKPEDS